MDTAQWPQEILVKPIEDMIPNTCSSSVVTAATTNNNNSNNNSSINSNQKPGSTSLERKVRPQKDHAVNCPRCNSTNTKFCYYNNYSLTQPRYFCKTCRRYWTEGGSLRNIPVGGGSRKNKRSSSSSSSSPTSCSASKKISSNDHHHHHHLIASNIQQSAAAIPFAHNHHQQNPKIHHHLHHQGQDLNLGFPPTPQEFRSLSEFMQLPTIESTSKSQIPNSATTTTTNNNNSNTAATPNNAAANHHLSALELLNGLTSSRGLTPFMPMPVSIPDHHPNDGGGGGGGGGGGVYSSGFNMQDYKPNLNFSIVEGLGYGGLQGEMHQQEADHHHHQTSNGRLLFPFEDLKQVSSTTSADHNNNNTNSADNHDKNVEQGEDDSTPGYWSGMLGSGGSW